MNLAAKIPVIDPEQVVGAAQAVAGASVNILNQLGSAPDQLDLEDIAVEIACALRLVLTWTPRHDLEANQLLGALERYLP